MPDRVFAKVLPKRVKLYSWNPRRSFLPPRIDRFVPIGAKVNNFGDLLGPKIVQAMCKIHGVNRRRPRRNTTLFSVGSVMHFASTGDVVWGTGVNGKVDPSAHDFDWLDVRAVRGELTGAFLRDRGLVVPSVFGDPALLLRLLRPDLQRATQSKQFDITYVPNFNDMHSDLYAEVPSAAILDPRAPLEECLTRIVQSSRIIGSSLHAIIVAETFGVPAIAVRSASETRFKYDDYYSGTGRQSRDVFDTVKDAEHSKPPSLPDFDTNALMDSFPSDLWHPA